MKRTFIVLLVLAFILCLPLQPSAGQSMQEKNKALMKQAYEYFNADNWDKLAELLEPNFLDHNPMPEQKAGFEGIKQGFKTFRKAFPDLQMTPSEILVDGDWACARVTMSGTQKGEFMGMKASGKKFSIQGFDLIHIVNGKATERYGTFDNTAMMMQLGMMPPPKQPAGKKMGEMKK